jgi:hypothetical protein
MNSIVNWLAPVSNVDVTLGVILVEEPLLSIMRWYGAGSGYVIA